MRHSLLAAVTVFLLALGACRAAAPPAPAAPDLKSFLEKADATLLRLSNEANQAGFTQATFCVPANQRRPSLPAISVGIGRTRCAMPG